MNKVFLDLENCHGIPKFSYTFEFDNADKKAHLIYAPNGVMKTSLANTFNDICTGTETKDHYYPHRKTKRVIKFEDASGVNLTKDDILVIEPYSESYSSENESVLLADSELKNRYESAHSDILEKMGKVFKILNTCSGKQKSEALLAKDFGYNEKDIFECLEKINKEFQGRKIDEFSDIKYSTLMEADIDKLLQNGDIIKLIQSYIEQFEKLLKESTVFKETFNHNNAESIVKEMGKHGFFKASHQVLLSGTTDPIGEVEFNEVIENEKKRIINVGMENEFKKIDNLLSAKQGTKALRNLIMLNRDIIPELADIDEFRRKLWISYLFKDGLIFQEAILNYQRNKKELAEIIEKAKTQLSSWHEVVAQFNLRFTSLPFQIVIKNKDDVVLKNQHPAIEFEIKNRGEEAKLTRQEILRHLSNGEKKALYLLNIIFEIEARKKLNKSTLVIMDDIADSFDYRNKYAIIEYIKEIADNTLFMPLILTHNFDFYRTVAGRVGIKPTSKFVNKTETAITLEKGAYFDNVFKQWRDAVYNNNVVFLSSIAFIRNLVEYTKGSNNPAYSNLTSLLHYKYIPSSGVVLTDDVTIKDLCTWYQDEWNRDMSKFKQDFAKKVIDLLMETADDIVKNSTNIVIIENKIVLSIAIRQKAERYMVKRISNDVDIAKIKTDQTRGLSKLIHYDNNDNNDMKIREIVERVLIIVSENIHINSFMYEPLVDISLEELVKLYQDVTNTLV